MKTLTLAVHWEDDWGAGSGDDDPITITVTQEFVTKLLVAYQDIIDTKVWFGVIPMHILSDTVDFGNSLSYTPERLCAFVGKDKQWWLEWAGDGKIYWAGEEYLDVFDEQG